VTVGIVSYEVDGSVRVGFEIDPQPGSDWSPAGAANLPRELTVRVRDAVEPAVEAAKAVLARFKEAGPDTVEVKFGVKVTGEANWIVAKAAAEGTFEVTLTWTPSDRRASPDGAASPDSAASQDAAAPPDSAAPLPAAPPSSGAAASSAG
jgi:hypothetical protein